MKMLHHRYPRLHPFSFAIGTLLVGAGSVIALVLVFFTTQNTMLVSAASSSTNYKTLSEDVNCGGGQTSSTSFRLLETLCDVGRSGLSSTNFKTDSGFPTLDDIPFITMSLSNTNIALGSLSTGSVTTGSTSLTVTTNSTGYTATITEDGNLRRTNGDDINDVSDGTVTAGSEEYGYRTTGSDGLFNSTDTAITGTPTAFASHTGAANSTTTVTLKAAIAPLTHAGNYHHLITIITTGTF